MIKKYFDFIKENLSKIEDLHHSLGEWVQNLCENNKEILELIKPYVDNSNPSVKLSNSINVLDNNDKQSIYKIIKDYLNGEGRKMDVRTFVDMTNESETSELNAGKNVFNSFLKVITSLGLKDTEPNWNDMPDDFLLFFEFKCEYASALDKIKRFNSLSLFGEKLPKQNCSLYFGIKMNLTFQFGFKEHNSIIKIGEFKLNKSSINYLRLIESKSAAHLKRELAYLDFENLKLICKRAEHMKKFHPGNTEERSFQINHGVLEFGYKALGTWNNGSMNEEEITRLKKLFNKYLCTFKYHEKILAKIDADSKSWIKFSIKLK